MYRVDISMHREIMGEFPYFWMGVLSRSMELDGEECAIYDAKDGDANCLATWIVPLSVLYPDEF